MANVKGLLLQIPNVINTRMCQNGTLIEYAKNGSFVGWEMRQAWNLMIIELSFPPKI